MVSSAPAGFPPGLVPIISAMVLMARSGGTDLPADRVEGSPNMLLILADQHATGATGPPNAFWVWPFAAILLSIAILPLLRKTHHWWEENRNKLLIALVLSAVTLLYYGVRSYGVAVHEQAEEDGAHAAEVAATQHAHLEAVDEADAPAAAEHPVQRSEPGFRTILAVLDHAVLKEYVPFLTLLFSLYVIAGGIVVRGDIQATPKVNTTIIGIGGLLASFIGTTGAAMVLIRLLLKTNRERKHVVHTVVFFIFIVANIGGSLLPIGDPPLFLGYLRGVEFFWTLHLWRQWLFMLVILLFVYYMWDSWAYRREEKKDIALDKTQIEPLRVAGTVNLLWLLGVVVAVATLDPAKPFPGTHWHAFPYLRELVQLAMVVLSLMTTQTGLRQENQFNYTAIGEVACLFIGIFITMQVPIEILHAAGPKMAEAGFTSPWQFFWATGVLSSFLDNAPTYVVYFETAATLPVSPESALALGTTGRQIDVTLLVAISCGAVFMGANSYIGNGPNFMVKSIAEQSGVKMPSFFGYMLYAAIVLIPLFVVLTLVFFRG
ncbi:MAG: sodium:proton antiporter [Planctomycetes bacterium]|nr:sodium:proton antiporter [Planctomycetota bacterium]